MSCSIMEATTNHSRSHHIHSSITTLSIIFLSPHRIASNLLTRHAYTSSSPHSPFPLAHRVFSIATCRPCYEPLLLELIKADADLRLRWPAIRRRSPTANHGPHTSWHCLAPKQKHTQSVATPLAPFSVLPGLGFPLANHGNIIYIHLARLFRLLAPLCAPQSSRQTPCQQASSIVSPAYELPALLFPSHDY